MFASLSKKIANNLKLKNANTEVWKNTEAVF